MSVSGKNAISEKEEFCSMSRNLIVSFQKSTQEPEPKNAFKIKDFNQEDENQEKINFLELGSRLNTKPNPK